MDVQKRERKGSSVDCWLGRRRGWNSFVASWIFGRNGCTMWVRLGAFVEEGVSVEQEVGEVEVGDDSNKVELCGF